MWVGALGLAASTLVAGNVVLSVVALSVGTAGVLAAFPVFWSSPTSFLGGAAAAAGIALINSIGNLAGFAASYVVGYIKELTQSTNPAMYLLAGFLILGSLLILAFLPARVVNR
jgi:nitrate/nitrite transporter NarK